jgi:epoxyqueuosine reductase
MLSKKSQIDYVHLASQIKQWGIELGFQQVAITDINLGDTSRKLNKWLENGYHGDMKWMASHGDVRYRPEKLLPGTCSVIVARMNYLPPDSDMIAVLKDSDKAYISRYALGRDYHKLIRNRLKKLSKRIEIAIPGSLIQRPFVDSAPVMEKPLAEKAGLGWMGKNTLIINSEEGSWFFLGEIYTSLPLPKDKPSEKSKCGECKACIKVCPTDAFPEPYVLDAKKCISYLTIENKEGIPEEFRKSMGNRVFGCDDCQIICPWNKTAKTTSEIDFSPRHNLDSRKLAELFLWTESEFLEYTEGSPIRRIGYERWLRNLAIGLGNAVYSKKVVQSLTKRKDFPSKMVQEHISWALVQQKNKYTRKKTRVQAPSSLPPIFQK